MTTNMLDALYCFAETTSGRIYGLVNDGIRQFKGVPYGAPTGGSNRFKPPQKPVPWSGPRECIGYAQVSPQVPTPISHAYGLLLQLDLAAAIGGIGEDCLHLNIWTPGLRDGAKRAVMVSFHGGGFAIGSGNGAIYDGAQLAKQGDAVVVTVTHRLASLGYLNLVDVGAPEEFAFAGVAGLMDLVAALEWVRDNIAEFSGDPGRVMIFGQSGGGWKTSALLGAPSAKGLFHRAAVQSGSMLRVLTREESARISAAFVGALGLTKDSIADIATLPWQQLVAAQTAIGALAFGPVLDGIFLPHHPFDPAAPAESAGIPLIVSTTLDDAGLFLNNFELNENGLKAVLQTRYGDAGKAMLKLYRGGWSRRGKWHEKSPFLLQAQIVTDSGFRRFAYSQAERKAVQGGAPVWMYQWDWAPPAYDGRFGALHAIDVPASFGNVREAIVGAGMSAGHRLCDQLSAAWVAFAKTGNPNNTLVPDWPAFEPKSRAVMIFDDPVRIVNDPNREIREFWNTMPPALNVF